MQTIIEVGENNSITEYLCLRNFTRDHQHFFNEELEKTIDDFPYKLRKCDYGCNNKDIQLQDVGLFTLRNNEVRLNMINGENIFPENFEGFNKRKLKIATLHVSLIYKLLLNINVYGLDSYFFLFKCVFLKYFML